MADKIVVYWRAIPAQVIVRKGRLNTTQIVAKEYNLHKEVLQQFKKSTDITVLKENAHKQIQAIHQDLQQILREITSISQNFTDLQPDKAPFSSLEVLQSQANKIQSIANKVNNITDLSELEKIAQELQSRSKEFYQALDLFVSKISYLPISKVTPAHRQLLERLTKQAKLNIQSLNLQFEEILNKSEQLEKEMLFIEIRKNEIIMGIYRRASTGQELLAYVQNELPQSKLSSEQKKLIKQLQNLLNKMEKETTNLQKSRNLQNVNHLDITTQQLFKEFDQLMQKIRIAFGSALGVGIISGAAYLSQQDNDKETDDADIVHQTIASSIADVVKANKNLPAKSADELNETMNKTKRLLAWNMIKQSPEKFKELLNKLLNQIKAYAQSIKEIIFPKYKHGSEKAFQEIKKGYIFMQKRKQNIIESYENWITRTQAEIDEYLANDLYLNKQT